ncbi:uncharacterized protein LOC125943578 [Dermacentor silvarum]|uniref:uncharacterized protein LOC125943578 n=1 Tax=Dermacentor silvarum TaxID=543639 RepID=UPI0021007ACA|nr:uncharacterized protein LOC125943578 [Dermacentor silvarum]
MSSHYIRSDKLINKKEFNTKKLGVVKTMQSASIGARLLSRCGRRLALKYKLDPTALHKALAGACIATHLCYSHIDTRKDLAVFQKEIIRCFAKVSRWKVVTNPELLGEELTREVDRMSDDIRKCATREVPKDKDLTLNVIRYLRSYFFTA